MKKIFFLSVAFHLVVLLAIGQQIKTYPTHWWTGMKNPVVQVMIHSNSELDDSVSVVYPGVRVLKVFRPDNHHYCFVDLQLAPNTKPGILDLKVGNIHIAFELKQKNADDGKDRIKGVTSADLIYLIMPDRFSNGDLGNDHFDDLRDKEVDRTSLDTRHGGDLKGVMNHLDYLQNLGITTVWLTPVMENDMPRMQEGPSKKSGYHGYWITNHYQVDKRMGGNEAYAQLIREMHNKGMKIIQDAVYNHVGSYHFTVTDLPFPEWINQWPGYQGTNHKEEVFYDPHIDSIDKKIMINGWFVPHLPDLNLGNPYVANFIIQNTIWCTEEFGVDGWRVDTYKYCDENFLNRINEALVREFPSITVFGEAWAGTVMGSAYFCQNNMDLPFKHNLQGVTDFPLSFAMQDAIKQVTGWTQGLNSLYAVLAQDGLYKDPLRNCIFLDNHDMDRFYSVVGENLSNFKLGIGLLLTQRGIPQIYYGTEILMKNMKSPNDGQVRMDFPGGWSGDTANKFLEGGRWAQEKEAFNYLQKLANYRKTSTALQSGKLLHYQPQNGVYVYFRYDYRQMVMCVVNSNRQTATIDLSRFSQGILPRTRATDVMTGVTFSLDKTLTLGPRYMLILELNM